MLPCQHVCAKTRTKRWRSGQEKREAVAFKFHPPRLIDIEIICLSSSPTCPRFFVSCYPCSWGTQHQRSIVVENAGKGAAHLVFAGGRPLREPLFVSGPFAMGSKADLAQAFEDFRRGKLA